MLPTLPRSFLGCEFASNPLSKRAARFVDIVKWAMRGFRASKDVEIRFRLSGNPLKLKQS
jgi:hypothetical protein